MVKCALVSVGVLVEPEQLAVDGSSRNLTLALEYQPEMSNLIIKVSDHDNDGSAEDSDQYDSSNNKSGSGKSVQKYRTLERVDSGFGGGGGRVSSRSTVRNRPSCRKSRSESQLLQRSPGGGNVKAYLCGIKTSGGSSPAHKSCDYYRQKFLQESFQQPSEFSDWIHFGEVHKTAGQKVVEKLAAQQKTLEAEAEQQKKKSSLPGSGGSTNSASDPGSNSLSKSYRDFVPLKKKPGRLEPIPLKPVKFAN